MLIKNDVLNFERGLCGKMGGIFPVFIAILLVAWMVESVKSGNEFRDCCKKIEVGMSIDKVLEIMGKPSFVKQHQDGSYEAVYEKSEWKGFFRGGTATRRMEIVFSTEDIVISVGRNDDCFRSGW